MKLGIIGLGMVGGALYRWFEKNTEHKLAAFDPAKNLNDDFSGIDAAFISVPVPPSENGQDLSILMQSVHRAKQHTENVFIRSTVLPGTSDVLKCIACPEFLTARRADADMANLPVICGEAPVGLPETIFGSKPVMRFRNVEAELIKFTHNCFGAMKVTYFNLIYGLANSLGADFESVKKGAMITGFIEKEHTRVPGPDGKFGYGGTCFPQNIESMKAFMKFLNLPMEERFFSTIHILNKRYRNQEPTQVIAEWEVDA